MLKENTAGTGPVCLLVLFGFFFFLRHWLGKSRHYIDCSVRYKCGKDCCSPSGGMEGWGGGPSAAALSESDCLCCEQQRQGPSLAPEPGTEPVASIACDSVCTTAWQTARQPEVEWRRRRKWHPTSWLTSICSLSFSQDVNNELRVRVRKTSCPQPGLRNMVGKVWLHSLSSRDAPGGCSQNLVWYGLI